MGEIEPNVPPDANGGIVMPLMKGKENLDGTNRLQPDKSQMTKGELTGSPFVI
jgi:hypothetical protein